MRKNEEVLASLSDINKKPITEKMGQKLAKEVGAVRYMECSSKDRIGLKEIMDMVIRVGLNAKLNKKTKLCAGVTCQKVLKLHTRVLGPFCCCCGICVRLCVDMCAVCFCLRVFVYV